MPKRSRSSSLPVFHSLFLTSDPHSLSSEKNSILLSSLSSPPISPGSSRASSANTSSGILDAIENVGIEAELTDEDSLVESIVVMEEGKKKSSASPIKMASKIKGSSTEGEGEISAPTSSALPSPPNVATIDGTDGALLESLGVDPELRASILEMDVETRTEVINDIVRQNRQAQMPPQMSDFMASLLGAVSADGTGESNLLQGFGLPNGLFSFSTGRSRTTDGPYTDEGDTDEEKSDEDVDDDERHQMEGEELIDVDDALDGMQAENEEDMRDVQQFLFQDFQSSAPGQDNGSQNSLLNMLMVVRQLMENQRNAVEQQVALERLGVSGDIDNLSYEELLDLEERVGKVSKGISEEKAKTVFSPVSHVTAEDGTCTICLDQLLCETTTDGTLRVCKLNRCSHLFHERCILGWLKESKKCPVCGEEAICGNEEKK